VASTFTYNIFNTPGVTTGVAIVPPTNLRVIASTKVSSLSEPLDYYDVMASVLPNITDPLEPYFALPNVILPVRPATVPSLYSARALTHPEDNTLYQGDTTVLPTEYFTTVNMTMTVLDEYYARYGEWSQNYVTLRLDLINFTDNTKVEINQSQTLMQSLSTFGQFGLATSNVLTQSIDLTEITKPLVATRINQNYTMVVTMYLMSPASFIEPQFIASLDNVVISIKSTY